MIFECETVTIVVKLSMSSTRSVLALSDLICYSLVQDNFLVTILKNNFLLLAFTLLVHLHLLFSVFHRFTLILLLLLFSILFPWARDLLILCLCFILVHLCVVVCSFTTLNNSFNIWVSLEVITHPITWSFKWICFFYG